MRYTSKSHAGQLEKMGMNMPSTGSSRRRQRWQNIPAATVSIVSPPACGSAATRPSLSRTCCRHRSWSCRSRILGVWFSDKTGNRSLPGKAVREVIAAALAAHFLEIADSSQTWPCDLAGAQFAHFRIPTTLPLPLRDELKANPNVVAASAKLEGSGDPDRLQAGFSITISARTAPISGWKSGA